MAPIRLIVQADDLGMCHAVNEGVVRAFTEGIVTQAAIMAPCPWFDEAAALVRAHAIPLGLHCTLTCEWDHLRWRPLTGGASLVEESGTMHRTVEAARAAIDPEHAYAELRAQAERVAAAGVRLVCCDHHMGPVCPEACARLCDALGVPFLYPEVEPHVELTSVRMLSTYEGNAAHPDKKAWLLHYIERLTPGTHYLCTHPAVPGAELASITRPDAANADWAERFRRSDLAVLTDPEVRAAIDARGIRLVSVADLAAA
ncbi:MAG TPA: ChbG/HpnK family deacetylase [Pseudomonadales bacterium]